MLLKAQMKTVGTRHYCSPLWYASDRNGLLIMVGGVGGDFSRTDMQPLVELLGPSCFYDCFYIDFT